jgi:predicted dehydrogenase
MSKQYRAGVIGFAHMHINYVAGYFANHPQVALVAGADTVPDVPELRDAPYTRAWNVRNVVKEFGIPRTYDDYHAMLETEELDIVLCNSENAKHPEIVEACAAAGVGVCVEKPMAASLAHALRMVRACRAAGTALMVSWPLVSLVSLFKIKDLIEEGAIGRVLEVKHRVGHTGPLGPGAAHRGVSEAAESMTGPERAATWWHQAAAGGGALLDFACYGAMAARWLVGEPPVAAFGLRANLNSQWADAEDNAAVLIRFPGAMANVEGSWTTWDHGGPGGPIVYGETGTLVADRQDDRPIVRLEHGHGQTTVYDCDPLPEGHRDVAEEFVRHLETGDPLHPILQAEFNVEVMAILDASLRSAASGKLEPVDNWTWHVGW